MSYRVSIENGCKSVLLGNLDRFNLNRLQLKRLIPIEHDLNEQDRKTRIAQGCKSTQFGQAAICIFNEKGKKKEWPCLF